MEALARALRRLEARLHVDRTGRSVWVWVIPFGSAIVIGALFGIMPGFPIQASWAMRLMFGVFGFVATLAVSVINMISFENDHNEEAHLPADVVRGPRSAPP